MVGERIRVGIVGANVNYGWGTRAHLPALAQQPGFDVRAVCTTRMDTAQETAKAFGVPLAFDNYDAMLAESDIDLVVVAVRVPAHHGLVMPALRAKKHVFCEWPLGANLAEAEEMRDLAHAQGVVAAVDLQARGGPALSQMRDMIADGYLGTVVSATMLASGGGAGARTEGSVWMADAKNGANTLTISAGHNIDALRYVLGEFAEVSAISSTQFPEATVAETGATIPQTSPDNVLVDARMSSGAVVSIHIESVPVHPTGFYLQIHGTEGALIARSDTGANTGELSLRGARRGDRNIEEITLEEPYRLPPGTAWGPQVNVGTMYGRIAETLRGGPPLDASFDIAVELHRILDAIERASATGQRQKV